MSSPLSQSGIVLRKTNKNCMKTNKSITHLEQVAEVEINYSTKVKAADRKKAGGSRDSYEIIRPFFQSFIEHREGMFVLLLDRQNRVIGVFTVSVGGLAGTVCDPRLVFQAAILASAHSIILAHNHPSGNLIASEADIALTRRIKDAGKLLEIQCLDHLIITESQYFSFADEGMM